MNDAALATDSPQTPRGVGVVLRQKNVDPKSDQRIVNLVNQLEQCIDGRIDFSDAARALYTSDASNYRQIPLGVVFPASAGDVALVAQHCVAADVPMLMRGGGTSQNGQCVNHAVVVDCSRFMNRVLDIDVEARTADVEPGVVCDDLKAAAEVHGLTFGPDPATHSRCTLGGMIGNNSCGPHSMLAGKTVENIIELDILTVDGEQFTVGPTSEEELSRILAAGDRRSEIYRELKAISDEYGAFIREKFPTIKRRVSGYNLDQLLPENGFNVARALVGTEGTCVSILRARTQLIANPLHKQLIVLGFDSIFDAGDAVPDILPFKPIAMEGLDWSIIGGLIDRNLRREEVALLPEGRAWILMELAADSKEELQEQCERFLASMRDNPLVKSHWSVTDSKQISQIWSIREQGASATSMSLNPDDPDPIVGWEDTAVDPLQLGNYLREFQALVDRYDYQTSLYGHFGDGCIHARITFDTRTEAGVQKWRRFSEEIARLVVKYGGSLSGEHGDGQAKAEFLPIMFGEELMQAFHRFKKVWDPLDTMNPGKVVNPYRMDENLRLGPDYETPEVPSIMTFHNDPGGIGRSVERCIGMGKCRARHGAMCPSFQGSNEERYSTRGRAHLLHELMRGEVIANGWADTDVEDSLANCLSCKACKSECPTKVDIASYKSEFMAKHYKGKRRPLAHYAFGHLGRVLPVVSKVASVANLAQKVPLVSSLVKKVLGVSVDKTLPSLASKSFRQLLPAIADELPCKESADFYWFNNSVTALESQGTHQGISDSGMGGKSSEVVLWIDSFNAHYRPELLRSSITLLTDLGFSVGVAKSAFCCGRPLYEYGFLDQAARQLDQILEAFVPVLPAAASIVVLEPSCLSVFKDELLKLRGNDERAVRLSGKCMTLADLIEKRDLKPKRKLASALMHLHCHHQSVCADSSDSRLLHQCIEEIVQPEEGCCGMAGAFGIQSRTRELSKAIYAKKLEGAVEALDPQSVVVTNGFSCHEQFADRSGLTALHPVEVFEKCFTENERAGA